MRHQKSGNNFSRTAGHRKALFANLVTSLLLHERIETTDAKAKELRRLADWTISWGTGVGDLLSRKKEDLSATERARLLHAIRMAGRMIKRADVLSKLFSEVAPRYVDRHGGYTRVIKTRQRKGDAAPMSLVELVRVEG